MTPKPSFVMAGPWNSSADSVFYRRVCAHLVEQGVKVTYFADRPVSDLDDGDSLMAKEQFPTRSCKSRRDVMWAYSRLRELRPDLIVARFASVNAMVAAAALARVPVRVVVHSTSPAAIAEDWDGSQLSLHARTIRKALVVRLATDHAVLTPGHADEIRRAYRLRAFKPVVHAIGIRDRPLIPDRVLSVVCVARLVPAKGQASILRALAGTEIDLTLVGGGPSAQALQDLATDLGVDLRFTGWIANETAREVIGHSQVSVLLSTAEAYSLSIVESLAAGTPVIATRASGPSYLVRDGVDGVLVPHDDPEAMRAALAEILGPNWEEYSASARTRFLEHFELDLCSAMFADQLLELASKAQR